MFIEQTKENEEKKAHGRFTNKNDTRSAHDAKYYVLEAVTLYVQRAVLTRRKRLLSRTRYHRALCFDLNNNY